MRGKITNLYFYQKSRQKPLSSPVVIEKEGGVGLLLGTGVHAVGFGFIHMGWLVLVFGFY